ncbi:transporter substrate-binding domain-containing protein [Salinisphaera sp. P385]|uniref:Transporter substrate-binding domain-containing protein n=1 Tax=Spectribacter acetivorans TaxID=3075603 RepID=A0ABU3B6T5_9GAMM|nr:transporter substrate-binding domain-containing protein [Salinisphaera sp. P385]MDT0618156.1 transporter substrate-binding domain-containing protein [Salinisphaera sp. P385]
MLRRLALFAPLLLLSATVTAQTLTVGTRIAPPFVVETESGDLGGISIELWERLAEDLDLAFEYQRTDIDGLLAGLQDGSLDVAVGALTMTAAREQVIDFTHPFHTTGLAVAVQPDSAGAWDAIKRFFSVEFLMAVLGLLALLLAVGLVIWLAERRANPDEFGGGTSRGLGNGLWWAAVTMTTVGYGDKSPRTLAGRIVGLVWMFAAIILISGFTAAIATSLTVGQLGTRIDNVDDLRRMAVTTVAGTSSAAALDARGIGYYPVDDLDSGLAELAAGRTDAVVYDAPILQYVANNEYPRRTTVLPLRFERQEYALAVTQDSPLRERLNQRILEIVNQPAWSQTVRSYLGAGQP